MKLKFLFLTIPTFLIFLLFGCSNNQNVGTTIEIESYEKAKEVAWEFIEKKGWNNTDKEGWKSGKVKKVIADSSYELLDKTFEGKELLIVSFKDNVVVNTPLILVAPDSNDIIGYMAEDVTLQMGEQLSVDLSDIEKMNIGSEMPRLLYADNIITIMQGTFGVVVYNIQESIVSNRISYENLKSYDLPMMMASVSQDGTTIYLGNDDMFNKFTYTYQYDISTGEITKIMEQPSNLFKPTTIETPGYNESFDKYFDLHYHTGDQIVELNHSFIYLRSSDWNMKNLQLVICQYKDGERKVYNVFN